MYKNALVTNSKAQCVTYLLGSSSFSFHEEHNFIPIKPTINKEITSSFTESTNITAEEMLQLYEHVVVKKWLVGESTSKQFCAVITAGHGSLFLWAIVVFTTATMVLWYDQHSCHY